MTKHWLTRLILAAALAGCLPATAAVVESVGHSPANEIFAFDRIDFFWALDTANADSVAVIFGDGTVAVLTGSPLQYRHFYEYEGNFQVTVVAWHNGQPSAATDPDAIRVQRRPVPGLNVFYLHHSTGRYMMRDCGFRSLVNSHNNLAGTDIRFWDHDYTSGNDYTGLILPDSMVFPDWNYGPEANDITPAGYENIYVNAPAFRDSMFNRHDVILMKNDHATGDITSEEQLLAYQASYLAVRNVMDQFPGKLFILLSGPPRQPGNITNTEADRARRFYSWLQSPEFMNGHGNICFFDLFDALAKPDDPGDPERNMIRPEYRRSSTWDDHPNLLANMTVGPLLADFMLRVVDPGYYVDPSSVPVVASPGITLNPAVPNPFNPSTLISWELAQPARVSLRIYNVAGQAVNTLLVGSNQTIGHHAAVWQGTDARGHAQPSGVYFYRLTTDDLSLTGSMALIR